MTRDEVLIMFDSIDHEYRGSGNWKQARIDEAILVREVISSIVRGEIGNGDVLEIIKILHKQLRFFDLNLN